MGKGNRSRTDRAVSTLANGGSAKSAANKNALTSKIAAIAVALVLAFFIVITVITSTGIVNSLRTAAKSDHYRVDGNMLNYLFRTSSQSYLQYASYFGIDTNKPLNEQTVDTGSDITWADTIMESVKSQLQQMIILCEAADKAGYKLSDEENKSINDEITELKDTAAAYGYSLKGFLKTVYGTGVTPNLVKKTLKMQTLASSYLNVITKDTSAALTDAEINTYFDNHKNDFLTSDFLQFAFTAKLDTGDNAEATEEQKTAYEAEKTKMKGFADKLAAAKTADEFRAAYIDCACEQLNADSFKSAFNTALADITFTGDNADAYKTMKDEDVVAAIAYIKSHIADEETVSVTDVEPEENATNDQLYQLAVEYARDSVLSSRQTEYNALEVKKRSYVDPASESATESEKWINDAARTAGDAKSFASEGDSTSTYTAVLITRAASRDESTTRNVAHILVTTKTYITDEDTKAKAEAILAEYKAGANTLDAFKALGEQYTEDSSVYYENVANGDMVEEFNDWLFDDARKVGDTDIVKTTYGYHVMYYNGEGSAAWFASAKDALTSSRIDDWFKLSEEEFGLNFNDKVIAKLTAQF